MLRVRAIPCLLYDGVSLVKTVRFKDKIYIGDPLNAIRMFNDKRVDELVFLDIYASKFNREPNFELIKKIASECFMPFAYGGGLKNIAHVDRLFQIGVDKIILNTSLHENPSFVKEVCEKYGSQSVVASIDVKTNWINKKKEIYFKSGKIKSKLSIDVFLKQLNELGVGEIIVNSIDNDGTFKGYDLGLIKYIIEKTSVPIIPLGGASSFQNFIDAINVGTSAVAAGSYFVLQKTHKAVLIQYLSKEEIEELNIAYNNFLYTSSNTSAPFSN